MKNLSRILRGIGFIGFILFNIVCLWLGAVYVLLILIYSEQQSVYYNIHNSYEIIMLLGLLIFGLIAFILPCYACAKLLGLLNIFNKKFIINIQDPKKKNIVFDIVYFFLNILFVSILPFLMCCSQTSLKAYIIHEIKSLIIFSFIFNIINIMVLYSFGLIPKLGKKLRNLYIYHQIMNYVVECMVFIWFGIYKTPFFYDEKVYDKMLIENSGYIAGSILLFSLISYFIVKFIINIQKNKETISL